MKSLFACASCARMSSAISPGGEEEEERRDDVEDPDALVVERRQPARHAAVAPGRGSRSPCGRPLTVAFLLGCCGGARRRVRPDVRRSGPAPGTRASRGRPAACRPVVRRVQAVLEQLGQHLRGRRACRSGRRAGRDRPPRRARGTWRRRGPTSRAASESWAAPGWSWPLRSCRWPSYSACVTTSTVVGMTVCRTPQSSAQRPSKTPSRVGVKRSSFVRPGIASRFPVSSGTHQLWFTSKETSSSLTGRSTGSTSVSMAIWPSGRRTASRTGGPAPR